MDYLRQDVDLSLKALRRALPLLRRKIEEGPAGWVDDEVRTAEQHWATWALVTVRDAEQAIAALDMPARRQRLTSSEAAEVDGSREEVSRLKAQFIAAGGRLLPADLPSLD